jgi:uncharacterized protein (TIGR02996 family)
MSAGAMELALLAAIRDAPDDDGGPLRVYVDWLLERDDVRGAYLARVLAPAPPPDELRALASPAARAWEERLGDGFRIHETLGPWDGVPRRLFFDGTLAELAARMSLLAPLVVVPLSINHRQGRVLVRADCRVLAQVTDYSRARGPRDAQRLCVRALPSLASLAEREHAVRIDYDSARDDGDEGVPRDLAFTRDADELRYTIDGAPRVLAFALPASS